MQKTLIITGASQGIGLACATYFSQKNWSVIALSRKAPPLQKVTHFPVDLSEAVQVETLKPLFDAKLNKQAQQICLIHNAFHHLHDSVGAQDLPTLQKAFQVSIGSSVLLNNLLVPYMASNSSILYIGSTLSELGIKNCASYTTLKHATAGLMRATCQDLSEKGIHTACICPGFTDTAMLREHVGGEAELEGIKSRVGAGRLIQPEEIASLCHYCAENPIISGSVLHANLGQINQ